jgi:hypothetical protein
VLAVTRRNAPQRKIPPLRRDFPALTQFASGLAILLALLALTRTVRILLLLAGLLAAALLLAGLLARVLILLARILVLVGHSGISLCVVGEHNGEITAKAEVGFRKTSVPARPLRDPDLS